MGAATENWESGLLAALEVGCARIGAIAGSTGLPQHSVRKLRREDGRLSVHSVPEIDWRALSAELDGVAELNDLLSRAVEQLEKGSLVELLVKGQGEEATADRMQRSMLIPILQRYAEEREDWRWDPPLAEELMKWWVAEQVARSEGFFRTISPLRYFDGPDEPISLDDGLVIRPLTDQDREELWRDFAKMRRGGSLGLLALGSWSHAVDYRWESPDDSIGHEAAVDTIEDVVRCLRLHHPGVVERTIVRSRRDPPGEPFTDPFYQVFLSAPVADYEHQAMLDIDDEMFGGGGPRRTSVTAGDSGQLRLLLEKMRTGLEDRRVALALSRFDSAYSRFNLEDSLIDLWIAFEALVLTEGPAELSYRASLRIAARVGKNGEERKAAFEQARNSYNCRSRVVHGLKLDENFAEVVAQTRELARILLRDWILDPPEEAVEGIDKALF
jgi:Apea-like HEPN